MIVTLNCCRPLNETLTYLLEFYLLYHLIGYSTVYSSRFFVITLSHQQSQCGQHFGDLFVRIVRVFLTFSAHQAFASISSDHSLLSRLRIVGVREENEGYSVTSCQFIYASQAVIVKNHGGMEYLSTPSLSLLDQ
jgi:hypothetical protein